MLSSSFYPVKLQKAPGLLLPRSVQERPALALLDELAERLTALAELIGREIEENGEQSSKFEADPAVDAPLITGVSVDEQADVISVQAQGALAVRWIADGKVIAEGPVIDLDEYRDELGAYVRAEVFGEGGVVYLNPFLLQYEGMPQATQTKRYIDLWFLASVIPDNIVRLVIHNPIWKAVWRMIQHDQ